MTVPKIIQYHHVKLGNLFTDNVKFSADACMHGSYTTAQNSFYRRFLSLFLFAKLKKKEKRKSNDWDFNKDKKKLKKRKNVWSKIKQKLKK